jgi:hypothetical protein
MHGREDQDLGDKASELARTPHPPSYHNQWTKTFQ